MLKQKTIKGGALRNITKNPSGYTINTLSRNHINSHYLLDQNQLLILLLFKDRIIL